MNIGRSLLKGSVVSTIALVAQVVLAFVTTPILLHSLGERNYGIWLVLMALIGYYSFLDFGISSSVARFLASAFGRNDEEEIHAVINTALAFFLMVGIASLLVTIGLVVLADRFTTNQTDVLVIRPCILIVGAIASVGFPVRVFQGILKGCQRYDLIAFAGLARLLVTSLLIWIFVRAGYGIVCLAAITALVGLMECILTIYFACRSFPAIRLGLGFYRTSTCVRLLGYSWRSFFLVLTQHVRFKMDSLVISGLLSVRLVAQYSIGARFMEYFMEIVGNLVGGQLMPVFSRYHGRDAHDLMRERFLTATRVSAIVSIFFGASLAFYGGTFIERWLGSGFDASIRILLILVGPYTLFLAQVPGVHLLFSLAKQHHLAWVGMGAAITNLALSLFLAKAYGLSGVAMGTAIELTLVSIFVSPFVVCRAAKVPLRRFFADALFGTFAKCLLPLGLYFFLVRQFLEPNYLRLITLVLGQILVFGPAVFYGVLRKDERALLLGAFRRRSPSAL